jgi:hypothetical protein
MEEQSGLMKNSLMRISKNGGGKMKAKGIFVVLICILISSLCMGCAQASDYIVRSDITHEDLEFVYDGYEVNYEITLADMFRVLGLPNRRMTPAEATGTGMRHYFYYFDDELFELAVVTFTFDKYFKLVDVTLRSHPMVYDIEPFEVKPVEIDRDKYLMILRRDITENELDVFDMESTSVDVQQLLGAPHDRISAQIAGLRTDAYTYPLTNGNIFLVSYERNGVIVKAWVVEVEGKIQKVLVDRTDEFGVWED